MDAQKIYHWFNVAGSATQNDCKRMYIIVTAKNAVALPYFQAHATLGMQHSNGASFHPVIIGTIVTRNGDWLHQQD